MLTTAHAPKVQRHSMQESSRSPLRDAGASDGGLRLEAADSGSETSRGDGALPAGHRSAHGPQPRHAPMPPPPRRHPELVAYCIIEREDAAPTWIRCGSARVNRDGSVNVRLDALPLNGELHLRPIDVRHLSLHRVQDDDARERDASLHS